MSDINFSPDDIKFIGNSDFIIRKNNLYKDIFELLSNIKEELTESEFMKFLPEKSRISGKISKGQNYHGLPYLVLDYPAIFKKDNIMAFRTIFWWGNYFSNILLLKGKYLKKYKAGIFYHKKSLDNLLIYRGKDPWLHDINKEYKLTKNLSQEDLEEQINENKFIKIAQKVDINKINELNKHTLNFVEAAIPIFT